MAPMKAEERWQFSTGAPKPNVCASTAALSDCRIPAAPDASGKPWEVKRMVPSVTAVRRMPRMKPASPNAVDDEGFFCRRRRRIFSGNKNRSRGRLQRPTPSQPTNMRSMLLARTRVSMANMKRFM